MLDVRIGFHTRVPAFAYSFFLSRSPHPPLCLLDEAEAGREHRPGDDEPDHLPLAPALLLRALQGLRQHVKN